jgi:hypothetical protein
MYVLVHEDFFVYRTSVMLAHVLRSCRAFLLIYNMSYRGP